MQFTHILDSVGDVPESQLVEQVRNVLLSESPDFGRLRIWLERERGLPESIAHSIIYQVICHINKALFPAITNIELILTEACNLACKYCFAENMRGRKRMPLNVALRAVDLLLDYSRQAPRLGITFFGGEPLLTFSTLQQVTEYAERRSISTSKQIDLNVTTNGTLIDKKKADYFAKHKIKVLLSIDGLAATNDQHRVYKNGRGTFDRVIAGLKNLKLTQPWIGARMTVMPASASNLFENVQGLHQLGVNQFIIAHATGLSWSEEAISSYGEQLAKVYDWYQQRSRSDLRIDAFEKKERAENNFFGCRAGRNSISIAASGQLSPCSKILSIDNRNLLMTLGDIDYGLSHMRNRYELLSCNALKRSCKDAGLYHDFQGGCFVSNYDEHKDIFLPSMQEHRLDQVNRSVLNRSR